MATAMVSYTHDDVTALDAVLDRVSRLHSAPQVAQRILELTRDLYFDVGAVLRCLESDPALAARVLRVVNSAHYGLGSRVTSLRQAVALLGQRSLRLVAMTFSLVDALARGASAQLCAEYWKQALSLAVVASYLAKLSRGAVAQDSAYAAGLVADLGILVLTQVFGESYVQLYQQHGHGPALIAAERRELGFGHAALGARLLERWEFPISLVLATLQHHELAEASPFLSRLVYLAHLTSEIFWQAQCSQLAELRRHLREHFGLDTDQFIDLVRQCAADIESHARLFEVELPERLDCQALEERARQQQMEAAVATALELDTVLAVLGETDDSRAFG
ncbi:MAG: HDOD domain-containing protein [Gemmatales bacterium]|nr:HDOD domain-containing protein [Gemmatales bacterium]MCS7161383.1 HDOD domain-containing protein [Gemmatales bacterium]MDW8176586.1 HDOD domain-containing protein [Gemmatales bacterium]MDW8223804.1 HDOD domain-containing protein [Gemmatales bacterium]